MNRESPAKNPESVRQLPHSILLEERKNLTVNGVLSVISCDPFAVMLETPQGMLSVGGEELSVSELSVRSGELHVSGKIEYLQYLKKKEKAVSLFKRLVR